MLILLGTLRCETAHNYASIYINGHEDFLTEENQENRRIIIAHDESIFRSGEIQGERWLHHHYSPFFNKGRGVSKMLSDFITSDPKLPIFKLGINEWEEAIKNEPWLEENSNNGFIERSATALIFPSKENYFDNTSILEQFKRLFTLIRYSSIFKSVNFRVDLLVDNATAHTKCQDDINLFAKSMNRSTPVEFLTWTYSEGNEEQTDCY
ncbi:unnamed protein product [Brachionus calyciflorus]|uniref:Uncharacterized protein n=1 Tax=Brachionus calyciflorus TaxID=104777 RepID=A0A813Y3C4_9BILA|nr:unnamed protein product [Brachionus calyciflorus]